MSSCPGSVALMARRPKGGLVFVLVAVALLAGQGWAQLTENLEIIWTIPRDTSLLIFGADLASGDFNGDGVPDIAVACDTYDVNQGFTPMGGRVYIYYGNHIGATTPDLVLRSPVWVGSNTPNLACGDLNGDGYDDIAMGEDMADDAYGVCTIWLGGNPMDTAPAFVIRGRSIWWLNNAFGRNVSLGDANGDGYGDLVVGAYFTAESPGCQGTGRVYLFHGGPNLDTIPDLVLKGGHEGDYEGFGIGVSATGDFDHDGFHDLYVGAWDYGPDGRGRMYVYYGGNPMDTSYDMAMSGEGPAQSLGWMKPGFLCTRGDFDYGVEGNPLWPYGFFSPNNCGKVYVHQGGRPMDSIPDVCLIGQRDSAGLGLSAQSAGDATGDEDDDLVAGAPALPPYHTGAAYLWQTGSHFDTTPDAWLMGQVPNTKVGFVVSTAGDLDGDGRDEFMVSNYPPQGDMPKNVWVCKYTGCGVDEAPSAERRAPNCGPTVVGGVLMLGAAGSRQNAVYRAELLDVGGRKVMSLRAGANDVSVLAPGVYFVREAQAQAQAQAIRKVVVTR